MAKNQNNPLQPCRAKSKRTGEPCKNLALPGKTVCRMHGANGGAPKGSQNARSHGLFAKCLQTPEGEAAYAEARETTGGDAARDAAALLMAQVAEAYMAPGKLGPAGAAVETYLMGLVRDQALSFEAVQAVLDKIRRPHITQLAKALAPLKNLLDKADGLDDRVKAEMLALRREQIEIERSKSGVDEDAEAKLPAAIPAHSDAWLSLVGGNSEPGLDTE